MDIKGRIMIEKVFSNHFLDDFNTKRSAYVGWTVIIIYCKKEFLKSSSMANGHENQQNIDDFKRKSWT